MQAHGKLLRNKRELSVTSRKNYAAFTNQNRLVRLLGLSEILLRLLVAAQHALILQISFIIIGAFKENVAVKPNDLCKR